MPIAHILIMEGREPEQKKALIRSVTAAIARIQVQQELTEWISLRSS